VTATQGDARVSWIPNQHGAWAFLVMPWLLGSLGAGLTQPSLLLLVAWLAGYCASFFFGRWWVTAARRQRRRRAVAIRGGVYTAVMILAGVPLLLWEPWLLWMAIPGSVVLVGSQWLTAHGRERGISNDLLLILAAAAMLPVAYWVALGGGGSAPPGGWWPWPTGLIWATLSCAAFMVGSVLHVKSLIRERKDRRWRWASLVVNSSIPLIGVAAASPALALGLLPSAVRAWAMSPQQAWKPGRIGAVESVAALAATAGILLAW